MSVELEKKTCKLMEPKKRPSNVDVVTTFCFIQRFLKQSHYHGEIIYGGTRWIEDDCSATFSEYIFLFPACLMISHWFTKNAELNSAF